MFSLRTGSLFDLAIIATDNYILKAADIFNIPNSTFAAYISGARFLQPLTAWDIGTRWGKYINQYLSNIIDKDSDIILDTPPNWKIPHDWMFEDDPAFEDIRWCAETFNEHFRNEYNLRQIIEPMSWQKSFSYCAAQVLARFEASQVPSKSDNFSKKDAVNLLDILINGPFTKENHSNMLSLAQRYILWRVKTREYYKLEQFHPTRRCIDVRDARPIPLLQQVDVPDDPFLLERKPCDYYEQLPDIPRLNKAATLDVLLLCHSVEVKADLDKGNYYCSCTTPANDSIYFIANPIITYELKYST